MLSFHLEVEINYLEIDREKLRHFDLNSWSLGFQLQEDRIVTSNIRVFLRPMPTKNKQFKNADGFAAVRRPRKFFDLTIKP
jgi:hypothetical protein